MMTVRGLKLHSLMALALPFLVALLLCATHVHARGHANLRRLYEQQEERRLESLQRNGVFSQFQFDAQHHAISPSLSRLSSATSLSASPSPSSSASSPKTEVTTEWFDQRLDHFEFPSSGTEGVRTFKQRFYTNFEHFDRDGGAAFIYIGGEAELKKASMSTGFIQELARTHKGAIFGLEHRFYGNSQPFPTLATENLVYLSVEQALEDLATFIGAMRQRHNLTDDHPWVAIGGSYPGAASAFLRLKYPNLVVGSLASSAPVVAKAEFWEYDAVVSRGAGPQCSDAIREATHIIEQRLDASTESASEVKQLFTCGDIPESQNTGFLYVLADAVSYAIQYTSSTPGSSSYMLKETLCDRWMLNTTSGSDPVERFSGFFHELLGRLDETCMTFTTLLSVLNDTSIAPNLNQRQWYWQSCTEFGFFQVAPSGKDGQPMPLRSSRIDLQYHLDLCAQAFSGWELAPTTQSVNRRYGGDKAVGSRIYFSNGSLDPWQALSITHNVSCCSSIIAHVIDGTAHCADLHSPAPNTDPPDLTATRERIAAQVAEWVDAGRQNIDCPIYLESCNGECVDTSNDVYHCGGCVPEDPVTPRNASNFYCSAGELKRIPGSQSVIHNSMFSIGLAFLVVGFVALALGLHALRKVHVMRTLAKIEAVSKSNQPTDHAHVRLIDAAQPLRPGDAPW